MLLSEPYRWRPRRRLRAAAEMWRQFRRNPRRSLVLATLIVTVFNTSPTVAQASPLTGAMVYKPALVGLTSGGPEQRFYYHSNHLGSVNVVTDDQDQIVGRRDYRPFGDPVVPALAHPLPPPPGQVNFTFDGQRLDDASGLYYFHARHYDAQLGRFLQADTRVSSVTDPQALNRYAFADNNPVRYSDPTGHAWWDFLIAAIIIVVAIVVAVVITAVTFGAGAALAAGLFVGALALVGGIIAGAVAASQGLSPTSEEFWEQVAVGAVLGAVIGAGIVAIPTMLAAGATFAATVGASMLFGAATGAIQTTIANYASGGTTDQLFGATLWTSIGIGAAIGAVTGGVTGGLLRLGAALGAKASAQLAAQAAAKAAAEGGEEAVDVAAEAGPQAVAQAASKPSTGALVFRYLARTYRFGVPLVTFGWAGVRSYETGKPTLFVNDPIVPYYGRWLLVPSTFATSVTGVDPMSTTP